MLYDGTRSSTTRRSWRPAGGVVRVVLVDEPRGWRALFCTGPEATVADRFSLEIAFRKVEEVVGAGKQQTRFIHAGVGAFHVRLWTHALTEARSGGARKPNWGTAPIRRPAHADKRRAQCCEMPTAGILAIMRTGLFGIEI